MPIVDGGNGLYDSDAKQNALMASSEPEVAKSNDGGSNAEEDSFENFTSYTTLHGLRFIGDHKSFLPRRFLWLLLVLMCATLVSLQVYDRVTYFMSSPITVNFKVNYNKTVAFPAVTICNQNNFRVSKAYKSKWLQYIMSIYGNDDARLHLYPNTSLDNRNMPVSELFQGLAHNIDDFIISCQWENEKCSSANFTTTLTSHGVCYTFNKADRQEDVLQVQNSGIDHGLKLTLNTEQYEVTAGPHDTTGIKMITTDQSDTPLVDEIGLAISTGTHAFVAIGAITINNLPPPHGSCVRHNRLHSTRYTPESCILECKTQYVVDKCGCRDFYMPDTTGEMRECTVAEYVVCLRDAVRSFNSVSDKLCDCPASCFYHIYEPTVSYATSSHIKADLKDEVNETDFKDRFFEASEIKDRMDFDAGKNFEQTYRRCFGGLDLISNTMAHLTSLMAFHGLHLEEADNETRDAFEKREEVFEFQSFIVQKNFLRGRDAMEEKALGMACQGFNEFVSEVSYKLMYLIMNSNLNSTEGRIMYILLQGALRSKTDTLTIAFENYTQLIEAYENGTSLFNFTYKNYSTEAHLAIVPKKLLSDALNNDDVEAGSYLEPDDMHRIVFSVFNYEGYINAVYGNESVKYDEEQQSKIRGLGTEFTQACEEFLSKKSILYSEIIDKPYRNLQKQENALLQLKNEYEALYKSLLNNIENIKNSVGTIQSVYVPLLKSVFEYGMGYLTDDFDEQKTKYDVALKFTEEDFADNIHILERMLDDTKRRLIEAADAWPALEEKMAEIWTFILNDEDIKEFTKLEEWGKFQETAGIRLRNIHHKVGFLRGEYERQVRMLESQDQPIIQAIQALIEDFRKYRDGHELNEDFYRENFLQVDVYFKELRSEQIDQQIAYDEIALLCDIGGSMGLFIGGSVITFFEIVDFICLFVVHKLFRRRRK